MKKFGFVLLVIVLLTASCTPAATSTPAAPQATQPSEAVSTEVVEPTQAEPAAASETPAQETEAPALEEPAELVVLTHDSFAITVDLVSQFEQANNAKLTFVKGGDTGSALNRAILSKDAPTADVFYGVDNTFLSRALEEDIFEPYTSPFLKVILAEFQLAMQDEAMPVDYGDVCINYDTAWFAEHKLAVPGSLADLLKPEYKDLLVVENPATSSPGLAFLLATVDQFGADGYLDFWKSLVGNGAVVVNDWETAYYTNFSASSGRGPQPMVVSYASSPAAEMIFADPRPSHPPTASVTAPGTCFRQVEFVGILKGTKQLELAKKFVDFMLDVPFQEDIPLQMFVYPVNSEAKLPADFAEYAHTADEPVRMEPQEISANREQWILDWTQEILQ